MLEIQIEDDDETYAEQRNRIRQSKRREEMYLKDSQRTEERAKFLQEIRNRKSCTNNEKNKSIKVRELNICEDTLAQLVDEQERLEKEQIRIKQEIVYNLQRQESIRRELAVETINNDPLNNTKTPAKYVTEDRNPLAKNNTDDRKPSGEKTTEEECTELVLNKHVTVDRQKPVNATDITQMTHDTNSELEFPALETDEDVETPLDSLGNECNPIIHPTEECSICLNDLYVQDNTPG